jgi:hypothetical protein
MWRKHPLIKATLGFLAALVAAFILVCAWIFGADYWQDGRRPPIFVSGELNVRPRPSMTSSPVGIRLTLPSGETQTFEINNNIARELAQEQRQPNAAAFATVIHSPQFRAVYAIDYNNRLFHVSGYRPGELFQDWQRTYAYLVLGVLMFGLSALIFGVLAFTDWALPRRRVQGLLIARVEQHDNTSATFSVLVRSLRPGHPYRFELDELDYLATDSADYIEIEYTPLFRAVRTVRSLTLEDLPAPTRVALAGLSDDDTRLQYFPVWRLRFFMYADGVTGIILLVFSLIFLVVYLLEFGRAGRSEIFQWSLLPMFITIFGVLAIFLLLRFGQKLRDLRAPRRVVAGPVLSKWRVNSSGPGGRHLIVVAHGGLANADSIICKFDLNPVIFDQLRVGDVIEIEHTPQMRFICRLQVTGHQELIAAPKPKL